MFLNNRVAYLLRDQGPG